MLGDIIDGKANVLNSSNEDLKTVMQISQSSRIPSYFCFGNHCHYNFSRELLSEKLCPTGLGCSSEKLYYDWSPYPGFRFISLDGYDVSLIGASSTDNKAAADQWLSDNNPNDLSVNGAWFDNLPHNKKRFVPYNGGISNKQVEWLRGKLQKANDDDESVIIYCHQPIFRLAFVTF